jgi:TRAP-type C4-dicarboxylate transport system permease small subunit
LQGALVTKLFDFLRKRADNLLALMMGLMFAAFVAQVFSRYVLNFPLAWTDEVLSTVWIWSILWGASFVMRNREDIRFDMLYNTVPRPARRVLTVMASGALVALLLASLPSAYAFVSFMKVERTPNFHIPLSWVYSIYVVFVVAMAVRHLGIVWGALRNKLVEDDIEDVLKAPALRADETGAKS